ncbi:flagellar biosynthesis protein FlgA [Blastococcus sp. TF02-8]|uniref:SAF domain-containing protein n=1 Tax=Blastococcus sp. TF02-8 TaxID=2250574 RepID=UPI000DE9B355|nr:SAF domain-containing protein [Blastococcus sp. TF02-8]RBY96470.1 flagellar biosynthesis protein FlgA [Blastococcus sp. TF02-8]
MTALRSPVPVPETADLPAGPTPRRVKAPGWLDLRLVLGALLVLGSVLLGARVISAADATVPVWSAARDLAAGTELTAEDLVVVDVRLDDAASAYLSGSVRPAGSVLSRAVGAGELLPRTALEEPEDLVQVSLPVQAAFVPPGLARGRLIDVYAVADPAAGATGQAVGSVSLVVSAAPVQATSGNSEGVLSTPSSTVQVVVRVPSDEAAGVLAAIAGRPLVVVAHDSVDTSAAAAERARAGGAGRPSASPSASPAPAPAPAPVPAPAPAPAPAGPAG